MNADYSGNTMKRIIIIVTSLIAVCVIVVGVWFLLTFSAAIREFGIQGNIAHSGYQIVYAIDEYTENTGHPPQKLDDLVPNHLSQIPKIDHVHHITYRVHENGSDWVLSLFRDPTEHPWEFRYSTARKITASEEERHIGGVHQWDVFEVKQSHSNQ